MEPLNAAHDMASLPAHLIKAIKCVVAAECIGIDKWNVEHPSQFVLVQILAFDPLPGLTPTDSEIFAHYAHQHPLAEAFQQTGLATPRKISDFLPTRVYHRTDIYNEFYRRIGIDQQMSIGFPVSPTMMLTAGVSRVKRDFTESDRRSLSALRPHLILAYRNAEAFAGLQREGAQLQEIIEESGRGLIVLDADGRARLITERARTLLHKYFAAPARSRRRLARRTHTLARASQSKGSK